MGLTKESAHLAQASIRAEHTSGSEGVAALRKCMLEFAPIVVRPTLFNAGHKKKRRILSIADVNKYTLYPTVLIPIGRDGSVNHAVCLVDDLKFDSTLTHALEYKKEVLDWICTGEIGGCVGIQQALRFSQPLGCSPLKHIMDDNWEK
jgi:hypothetical protein